MAPLLKSKQVQARYGIARVTLWRWLRDDKFPNPITVNGRNYWRQEALEIWERQQEVCKAGAA